MNAALPIKRPNLPVEYEEAVRNLVACITLDEAKYWNDKAEALAAWAKIYNSDRAGLQARRLKLHAYRRMGELARELQPGEYIKGRSGRSKGPLALLVDKGLNLNQASCASAAARLPADKFSQLVDSPRPPPPTALLSRNTNASEAWGIVSGAISGNSSLMGFAAFCRKHDPKQLAKGLTDGERQRAEALATPVMRWLRQFEKAIS